MNGAKKSVVTRRSKTAAELNAELDQLYRVNPEAARLREEYLREAHKQREFHKERNRREAAPIVAELQHAGYQGLTSIADLVNFDYDCKAAFPILRNWLPRVRNPNIKEDIVRALSDRKLKGIVTRELITEFHKAQPGSTLQWSLGNALSVVADKTFSGELGSIAGNSEFTAARQMVIIALGKLKDRGVGPILVRLLDEEGVQGHALNALGNLHYEPARSSIEQFLTHRNAWFRREAKTALAKLDRAQQKDSTLE